VPFSKRRTQHNPHCSRRRAVAIFKSWRLLILLHTLRSPSRLNVTDLLLLVVGCRAWFSAPIMRGDGASVRGRNRDFFGTGTGEIAGLRRREKTASVIRALEVPVVVLMPVSRLGGRAGRGVGAAFCRLPAMELLLPVSGALHGSGSVAQGPVLGAGAASQGNPAISLTEGGGGDRSRGGPAGSISSVESGRAIG
jgi:hypothetical protein